MKYCRESKHSVRAAPPPPLPHCYFAVPSLLPRRHHYRYLTAASPLHYRYVTVTWSDSKSHVNWRRKPEGNFILKSTPSNFECISTVSSS